VCDGLCAEDAYSLMCFVSVWELCVFQVAPVGGLRSEWRGGMSGRANGSILWCVVVSGDSSYILTHTSHPHTHVNVCGVCVFVCGVCVGGGARGPHSFRFNESFP